MGKTCEICHSISDKPFMVLPDFQSDLPVAKYEYRQCINCGLVFSTEATSEYNNVEYPDEYGPHKGEGILSRKRVRVVSKYCRGGKILDIGCGGGDFLAYFSDKPLWFPYGIEPAPKAAQAAARISPRIKIIQNTITKDLFEESFFDVITLWDALEHLPHPSSALEHCFNWLKPGGLLVLRVPNLDSFDFDIFHQYWAGLDAPRHKFIFNRANLCQIISERKFIILELKSNIGYYPNFLKSVEYWLRGRKVNAKFSSLLLSILKNPAARILSAPIFFLAGEGTSGSELVLTAKKPL